MKTSDYVLTVVGGAIALVIAVAIALGGALTIFFDVVVVMLVASDMVLEIPAWFRLTIGVTFTIFFVLQSIPIYHILKNKFLDTAFPHIAGTIVYTNWAIFAGIILWKKSNEGLLETTDKTIFVLTALALFSSIAYLAFHAPLCFKRVREWLLLNNARLRIHKIENEKNPA